MEGSPLQILNAINSFPEKTAIFAWVFPMSITKFISIGIALTIALAIGKIWQINYPFIWKNKASKFKSPRNKRYNREQANLLQHPVAAIIVAEIKIKGIFSAVSVIQAKAPGAFPFFFRELFLFP